MLRKFWRWLTTPRKDLTQELLPRGPSPDLVIYDEVKDFIPPPSSKRPPILDEALVRARNQHFSERSLLPEDERRLWEQLAPESPEKEIHYPAPAEQSTQDWVTERLKELTGGLTRHPGDRTQYPVPPTEADLAAREWAAGRIKSYFSVGFSMRYLGELKRRADERDLSLTAEQLMGLRSRGIC